MVGRMNSQARYLQSMQWACRIRSNKRVFLANAKKLGILVLMLALTGTTQCKRFFQPEIPTGIERRLLADGNLEIISTGKASKNAIEKDSVAMKQTTSREAARLILEAELQNGNYPGHKERFEIQSVEFLYDFEYCIIKGKYKKK